MVTVRVRRNYSRYAVSGDCVQELIVAEDSTSALRERDLYQVVHNLLFCPYFVQQLNQFFVGRVLNFLTLQLTVSTSWIVLI